MTGFFHPGGPQQSFAPPCIGGQRTDPYEQNTQQSPAFGLSIAWQRLHS